MPLLSITSDYRSVRASDELVVLPLGKIRGGSFVERWEYLTQILSADINNRGAKELIKQQWPNWNPPRYTPETIMPHLNSWGERGWELVHMEPVAGIGDNGDVVFTGDTSHYSSAYFCVFKRRKES